MSTSPSWFDQEKFSRLVKKVGTTTRSIGAPSAPGLPASSPASTSSTGPVQLPPEPAPAAPKPTEREGAPPEAETPARPPSSAIPKPAASAPLFSFKSATSALAAPKTPPPPEAKAPEPEPAPEETPNPPPVAPPPRTARVFLTPAPAEVSPPAPEPPAPEAEVAKKPDFTFEIPESELPSKTLPPEAPPENKIESASDFHIAEPPHVAKKPSHTTTSTLQRLPRIMPGGSKAPAPPTQTRSVSALARRTSSLPGIKQITAPPLPMERTEAPIRVSDAPEAPVAPPPLESAPKAPAMPPPLEFAPKAPKPTTVEFRKETKSLPPPQDAPKTATTSLAGLGRQTKSLPPLSKHAATSDSWESSTPELDEITSYKDQIAHLNQERDWARLEAATLREQLAAADTAAREQGATAPQDQEVTLVTAERDAARRDYTELRQQYETLKQDQVLLKSEHAAAIADLQQQIDAGGSATGRDDVIETLKQELKNLHEQVAQAKDEASTAQRGLALSQKALQETRDALREAGEGKGMLESLRKERSTLVQQNMVLQAQNDQVSRELSALKAKTSK